MASLLSPDNPPLTPETPASVQPGGLGVCGRVEMAWGRLRRAWLRRFRPRYVQRLTQKRQGDCPNCPHDIIDPRDLKYWRNVCGFWFRPEDDAFRWRERLWLARHGLAELLGFSLVFALLTGLCAGLAVLTPAPWSLAFYAMGAMILLLWGFVIRFFRDPERSIPTDPDALLSPADGTVTHVGEVDEADFPGGRAFRISIFLSVFNVHVNRVPCSGRVLNVRYFRGCFLDARHADCSIRNEQLWIDLEPARGGQLLRVKQVSGAIARRIVCWLRPGEEVRAGDRFGMIKFGSRTEVFLPAGSPLDVCVQVGDKVHGGSSILLRRKS